jgi:dolichol-phosphate mannosyltransferase
MTRPPAAPADNSALPLVSLVIPVFNEEENIEACYRRICELARTEAGKYRFEFVFTDNHSTDSTWEKLAAFAKEDPRIRVFRFSRNFGYQMSILTGYRNCLGACAVQLDCDLQDPPEMVHDFLRLWESGHKVVYGIRRTRRESYVLRVTRKIFYRILSYLSSSKIPVDAGDFRLIDRVILDELSRIRQGRIYLRGRIAEMGFNQVGIEYDRRERAAGESKFTLWQYFSLAIDAITAHSAIPLRLATFFGFAITVVSFIASVSYAGYFVFFAKSWPPGFTTLAVLATMSLGLLSLFIGILGEYLSRVFEEVIGRQEVIVERAITENDPKQVGRPV